MNLVRDPYWLKLGFFAFITSAALSKVYFLVLLFSWGTFPDSAYDALLWISNWPSLVTDTFPWFYDGNGVRGVSIPMGLADVGSVLVNFLGQLPIALLIGMFRRRRGT